MTAPPLPALVWREDGDVAMGANYWLGGLLVGWITPLQFSWVAGISDNSLAPSVLHPTRRAAQDAVERAVRDAMGVENV